MKQTRQMLANGKFNVRRHNRFIIESGQKNRQWLPKRGRTENNRNVFGHTDILSNVIAGRRYRATTTGAIVRTNVRTK